MKYHQNNKSNIPKNKNTFFKNNIIFIILTPLYQHPLSVSKVSRQTTNYMTSYLGEWWEEKVLGSIFRMSIQLPSVIEALLSEQSSCHLTPTLPQSTTANHPHSIHAVGIDFSVILLYQGVWIPQMLLNGCNNWLGIPWVFEVKPKTYLGSS